MALPNGLAQDNSIAGVQIDMSSNNSNNQSATLQIFAPDRMDSVALLEVTLESSDDMGSWIDFVVKWSDPVLFTNRVLGWLDGMPIGR
jgi:hypothetical protein